MTRDEFGENGVRAFYVSERVLRGGETSARSIVRVWFTLADCSRGLAVGEI